MRFIVAWLCVGLAGCGILDAEPVILPLEFNSEVVSPPVEHTAHASGEVREIVVEGTFSGVPEGHVLDIYAQKLTATEYAFFVRAIPMGLGRQGPSGAALRYRGVLRNVRPGTYVILLSHYVSGPAPPEAETILEDAVVRVSS
jgi:hypothetical protein